MATDSYTTPGDITRPHIGKGYIDNVFLAVWEYQVSGKHVLRQWFSYRRLDRSRPVIGDRRPPSPLDKIQRDHWPAEYTTDLMDLLHVLGRLVKLEPAQAELLDHICAGPTFTAQSLASPVRLRGQTSGTTDNAQTNLFEKISPAHPAAAAPA